MTLLLLACLHRGPPPAPAAREPQPVSHVARAHYLAARAHLERGDLEKAAQSYKRAVLFDDDSPRLYLELGELRLLQGDAEAAEAWLEEAVALGGGDPARVALALAWFELGRLAEAEAAWSSLPPSPHRAELSLRLGHMREAIAEAAPNDLELLTQAAHAGALCGPALDRAVPQRIEEVQAMVELAMACGDPLRARPLLDGLDERGLASAAALQASDAALARPLPETAPCALRAPSLREDDLEQALGLLQGCADFTDEQKQELAFTWTLAAGGDVEPRTPQQQAELAAVEGDWARVAALADGSARGLGLRGRASLEAGDRENARRQLRRSLEMAPGDAQVKAWLALAESAPPRYPTPDRELSP